MTKITSLAEISQIQDQTTSIIGGKIESPIHLCGLVAAEGPGQSKVGGEDQPQLKPQYFLGEVGDTHLEELRVVEEHQPRQEEIELWQWLEGCFTALLADLGSRRHDGALLSFSAFSWI